MYPEPIPTVAQRTNSMPEIPNKHSQWAEQVRKNTFRTNLHPRNAILIPLKRFVILIGVIIAIWLIIPNRNEVAFILSMFASVAQILLFLKEVRSTP